jgi:hypothetical protein
MMTIAFPRRRWSVLLLLVCAGLAGLMRSPVAAQQRVPVGSIVIWPAGWNLISFGADTSFGNTSDIGTLYGLPPEATGYQVTDVQHTTVGSGYWTYFQRRQLWIIRTTSRRSSSLTIPGGRCVLVGNPGTAASARVVGASRVLVWSPLLQSYVQQSLLGIGRGAWACNDTDAATQVSIEDQGDVLTATFPDCCRPQPYGGGGQVLLTVQNASPYPMTAGLEPIDAAGQTSPEATTWYAIEQACASCPEYDPSGPAAAECDQSAVEEQSFTVPAGRYLLHMQSDGPSVPDLQNVVDLQPDTAYHLCYYVSNQRPRLSTGATPELRRARLR